MPQEERYDIIRVCEHESDYSVLYDFVGMRHAMCNSCWHEEEHVRTGRDTESIFRKWQLRAVNVVCLRWQRRCHGAEGMYQVLSGFTEKNGEGAVKEMWETIHIAHVLDPLPNYIREKTPGSPADKTGFLREIPHIASTRRNFSQK